MVNGVQSSTASAVNPTTWSGARGGPEARTAQLAAQQASRALDAELKIVTDEGDTVTLSLGTETDVSLATYSGRIRGNGGKEGLRANFLTVSSRNDVNITVEGDLNKEERADVYRLVSRIGNALRSFLHHHIGAAIHQLLSIGNLGSLAGFDLKATRTEETTTTWWKKLIS